MQLYLPKEWAHSRKRRAAAGVPTQVRFARKWEIALEQIEEALEWGVRPHVVLADAGYGDAREFRQGLRQRGLHYLVGVQGMHKVWPPGASPARPEQVSGKKGRPRTRYVAQGVAPWSIEELALQLPPEDCHTVSWREGSRGEQSSRFAAVRVHSAERHVHGSAPGEEEWLLVEWPRGQKAPTKYYRLFCSTRGFPSTDGGPRRETTDVMCGGPLTSEPALATALHNAPPRYGQGRDGQRGGRGGRWRGSEWRSCWSGCWG